MINFLILNNVHAYVNKITLNVIKPKLSVFQNVLGTFIVMIVKMIRRKKMKKVFKYFNIKLYYLL